MGETGYVAPAPSTPTRTATAMMKSSSDTVLDGRTAVDIIAGKPQAVRTGPHWPPPGKERPDPIKTRANLFQGSHRTFVDHHQRDRQAPVGWQYTLTNF